MYGEDGRMCVALMKLDRPKWRNQEEHASDAEKISAASGFSSYCGRYEVDEANHVITHFPEVSFYPNFVGTVQKRPYRLETSRLTFSDVEANGEVERWTIAWEKLEGNPADGEEVERIEKAKTELARWEQQARDADLQGNVSFHEKRLSDDWTGGTSWGSFQSKGMLVSDLKDTEKNITAKETLSDMEVRLYGDAAVTTFAETYDALIHGERTAKTIITTGAFIRRGGRWLQVASYSSAADSDVKERFGFQGQRPQGRGGSGGGDPC